MLYKFISHEIIHVIFLNYIIKMKIILFALILQDCIIFIIPVNHPGHFIFFVYNKSENCMFIFYLK